MGMNDGRTVGTNIGRVVGNTLLRGAEVGPTVGVNEKGLCDDGVKVGAKLGTVEGPTEFGCKDGNLVGIKEGTMDTGLGTGSENDIDEAATAPDELHFSFRHTRVNSALNSPLTTLDRN